MQNMFRSASKFSSDLSNWDTSKVTNMAWMFSSATGFNSDLSNWDTSKVKNMAWMFQWASVFTSDLSNWDTGKVTNMASMFLSVSKFTSDLSRWNTSNVMSMQSMFQWASSFTSDLSNWNTSQVTTMQNMFRSASKFSSDLSNWDTSKVANMAWMFSSATSFNSDLSRWNTSNVTAMQSMFQWASKFSSDLSNWNTSKVTDMYGMFSSASSFNSDLSNWDTSKVTNMSYMFFNASKFTSDLSNWDTSQVTTARNMFAGATGFNSDLSNWDTQKMSNMGYMFWSAKSFDSDLSKRDFSGITGTQNLISFIMGTLSYSLENYEKLLKKFKADYDAGNTHLTTVGRIDISAPYCNDYQLRDELKTLGINLNSDRFDCWPEILIQAPTKQSNQAIEDIKVIFRSKFLLSQSDVALLTVNPSSSATTVTYSDFNCSLGEDQMSIECGIKITSTNEKSGQKIGFLFSKDVGPWRKISASSSLTGLLIDTQEPQLAQLRINTSANGIAKPDITMSSYPLDQWAAGLDRCELYYTDEGNNPVIIPLRPNETQTLALNSTQTVHTVKVKCYDKVGNASENVFKFPPIIFSKTNITLSNEVMTGAFWVYSPGPYPITEIRLEDPDGVGVILDSCISSEDQGTVAPYANSEQKPVICSFSNVKKTGRVVVIAKDANGAEGQNSQSFTLDQQQPTIDILPLPKATGGEINFKITVTDNHAINTGDIEYMSNMTFDGAFLCVQKTVASVECSAKVSTPIEDWWLEIKAKDRAKNEITTRSEGYILDKTWPKITFAEDYQVLDFGQQWKIMFEVEDEWGAGLWKKDDETSDLVFDGSAVSYWVSPTVSCTDPEGTWILAIPNTDSYHLSIDLSDPTQNGKYLCVQAKDKVWNAQIKAFETPLNINLAPTLAAESISIAEHTPVWISIFTLSGHDANLSDQLSYAIIAGNTGEAFGVQGTALIVSGALDYETLANYQLTLQVQDQFWLTGTALFTINITDVDEISPVLTGTPTSFTALQGTPFGPILFTGTDNLAITEWIVAGLPAGLSFEATTGTSEETLTLSGTLSAAVGTYPITISAKDAEGNKASLTFVLVITAPSSPSIAQGRSGGGGGRPITNTSTQNTQTQTPTTETNPNQITFQESELFNPSIEDGKCYFRRAHQGIQTSKTIQTTEEFNKALSFLWSYEMTKFDSVDGYDPNRNLSREEAAKLFANFAMHVLCRQPDKSLNINYSDTANADPSLTPYITLAYQLGLMKGSGQGDGLFRPYEMISKAEVNAVLIRMILKAYLNETSLANWFSNYNEVATKLGIINQWAGLQSVPRNDVALMLFRAYKNQAFDRRMLGYESYVLKSRDLFVK